MNPATPLDRIHVPNTQTCCVDHLEPGPVKRPGRRQHPSAMDNPHAQLPRLYFHHAHQS